MGGIKLSELGLSEEEIKKIRYVAELFNAQWVRLIEDNI